MITANLLVSLLLLGSLSSLTASSLQEGQGEGLVFEAVPTQVESPLDTTEVLHNSLVCSHSTGSQSQQKQKTGSIIIAKRAAL